MAVARGQVTFVISKCRESACMRVLRPEDTVPCGRRRVTHVGDYGTIWRRFVISKHRIAAK